MELTVESERVKEEKDTFESVVFELMGEMPGVLLCDVDYVLRRSLDRGLHLRFGEIPQKSIDQLKGLLEKGWVIKFVTNQPEKGHQIAQKAGELQGYVPFPKILTDNFGADSLVGAGWDFFTVPWTYKQRPGTAQRVVEEIKPLLDGMNGDVVMVSDQKKDRKLLDRVSRLLGAERKTRFIKLPGPIFSL